jgi:hypothetical protein
MEPLDRQESALLAGDRLAGRIKNHQQTNPLLKYQLTKKVK